MQGQREILSPYNHSAHLTQHSTTAAFNCCPMLLQRRAELSDADVGWMFTTCCPAPSLSLSHIQTCVHTPSHPLFFAGPAEGKFWHQSQRSKWNKWAWKSPGTVEGKEHKGWAEILQKLAREISPCEKGATIQMFPCKNEERVRLDTSGDFCQDLLNVLPSGKNIL